MTETITPVVGRMYAVEALLDLSHALSDKAEPTLEQAFDAAARIFVNYFDRWEGVVTFGLYDPKTADPIAQTPAALKGDVLAVFTATYREKPEGSGSVISNHREVILAPVF